MISPDLTHCNTLKEWYEELKNLQEIAHGKNYTSHHDINLNNFRLYKHLFEREFSNIREIEASSIDKITAGRCDFLFINTIHSAEHVKKELELHSSYVNEYILIHDTFKYKKFMKKLRSFVKIIGLGKF